MSQKLKSFQVLIPLTSSHFEARIMQKILSLLTTTVLLLAFHSAHSANPDDDPVAADNTTADDPRTFVSMPDQTRRLMQADMLDNLAALNEIIGHMANDNLSAAADVEESRMGRSSMGKHHGTGMGPGRYMPFEMRKLGRSMHFAASDFAQVAKRGDKQGAYAALQKVTTACVACHYSFRTE